MIVIIMLGIVLGFGLRRANDHNVRGVENILLRHGYNIVIII